MGLVEYIRQLPILLCLYILVIPNECYFLFIINQMHDLNTLKNLNVCAEIKPNTPEYFLQHGAEIYNTNELNALYNTTPQSLTTETAQEFFRNRDGNGTTQFQKPQAQDIADACTDVGQCDSSAKYRTYNGACNNLRFKNWGLSGAALVRLVPAYYEDGKSQPRLSSNRKPLPNPRLIHKSIFKQKLQNDAVNTYGLLIWGQMVAHDTARISFQNTSSDSSCTCCTKNGRRIPPWKEPKSCYPIDIDTKDDVFSKYGQTCMYFVRSASTNNLSCTITPQQLITLVSHYIDMSILYGSNERDANNLRTFKKGLLKSRDLRGKEYMPQTCKANCHRSSVCYMAGDPRVNDVIILSVVHLVFLRHHNRIVRKLAVLNPSWTDEKLYQHARRIVIAMVQHITYDDFLPIILGDKYVRDNKLNSNGKLVTNEYSQTTNAGTLVSFTSCAWRIFHSLIPDNVNFYSEDRKVKLAIPLSELYNKPQPLESQKGLDGLIRTLCSQPSLMVSKGFTPQVTDMLFRGDKKTGGDLIATDIQRSRDHGVARYVDLRVACGLKKVNSFNDLLDVMTLEDITKLEKNYLHVDDIDCMVGCMLEKPLQGSMVGPTLQCIIGEQFKRWKNGDRFFYTFGNQTGSFTQEQLTEISKSSFSYVLCLNGNNIQFMQKNSFQQVSKSNPLIKCSDVPKMSFLPWKEKNNK